MVQKEMVLCSIKKCPSNVERNTKTDRRGAGRSNGDMREEPQTTDYSINISMVIECSLEINQLFRIYVLSKQSQHCKENRKGSHFSCSRNSILKTSFYSH